MKKSKPAKIVLALATSLLIAMGSVPSFASADSLPAASARELAGAATSKQAAEDGMVLLKNSFSTLPLKAGETISVFGQGQINTVKGGTGSGDVNNRNTVNILAGLENNSKIKVNTTLADIYTSWCAANPMPAYSGGMFGHYPSRAEMPLTDTQVKTAAASSDAAIVVISRTEGEGQDRTTKMQSVTINGVTYTIGDYYLSDNEAAMLQKVNTYFKHVVVILNVGAVMDTSWIKTYKHIDSVLFSGYAGQEGGNAIADILTGAVSPSGHLTDTWALNYSDYPSGDSYSLTGTFGSSGLTDANGSEEVDYTDGIYVGYRYFDSFGKDVAYPFGYGLSYTKFNIKTQSVKADANNVDVTVTVTNRGNKYSGKEVVQLYYSAPKGSVDKPYQELAAYAKTDTLAPHQSQTLTISYKTSKMASYSTSKSAYVLDAGNYIVRVGDSSRNTHVGAVINLNKSAITERDNKLEQPPKDLAELNSSKATPISYPTEKAEIVRAKVIHVNASTIKTEDGTSTLSPNPATIQDTRTDKSTNYTLLDVYNKKCTMSQFVAQMSANELATLLCGGGTSAADRANTTFYHTVQGAAGQTSAIVGYGIPSTVVSDGPAGIRITQSYTDTSTNTTKYQFCTCMPCGTIMASSWDENMIQKVGQAIGVEMKEYNIDQWLAPGMNIHRDPLNGRNFEYYSEDPVLSGVTGAAVTKGVQSQGVGVTIKHYVLNNQETNRMGEDNFVSERAEREIYLKGFEIAVKAAQPWGVMSSYNRENGRYSSGNYDILSTTLRAEWGFTGYVMTDWGGGATVADGVYARNDVFMPGGLGGGFGVGVSNIVSAYTNNAANSYGGTITLGQMQRNVIDLLNVVIRSPSFAKAYNLTLSSYTAPTGYQAVQKSDVFVGRKEK